MTLEKIHVVWDFARLLLGCSLLVSVIIGPWKN